MRGEFSNVWAETWSEIWVKLGIHREFGNDLYSDLYRELILPPRPPDPPPAPDEFGPNGELLLQTDFAARELYERELEGFRRELAEYEFGVSVGNADDDDAKRVKKEQGIALRVALKSLIHNEIDAVNAMEAAFRVVSSYGSDAYSNRYFQLVERFMLKFSLRYDLRRPFSLHPTLPGIFARLITELKRATLQDANLNTLMMEFEEALRDIKTDPSSGNIKTCIQKQMNLLEALGQDHPNVHANTLGQICNQVNTWPHNDVKDAMKKLYGFACDYPGVRHGGTRANAIRQIEMRDLVSMSILLAGFTPYLTEVINSEVIFNGV